MASLWKALKNSWREKKEQAAEKMSDPIRDGKFAIADSKKKLDEIQSDIAKYSAQIKMNQRRLDEETAAIKKWKKLSEKAAKKENVDDVRKFVQEKNNAQARADDLKKLIAQDNAYLEKMKSDWQTTNNKVSKAESNHAQLAVRKQMATARKELKKAHTGLNSDSCFAALDDLEKAVVAEECEAEALEEMAPTNELEAAEERYGSTGEDAVEDEVAALMAKAKK